MNKQINVKDSDLRKRVDKMAVNLFGYLSESEISVLTALIDLSDNNSIHLGIPTVKHIKSLVKLSGSGLSTVLSRLNSKTIIKRTGKNIQINPAFDRIKELKMLIISFS